MDKRLVRPRYDRKLAGVCSGIANYFNVDPTMVRLICILLIFIGGMSLWIYIIAALIIPNEY